MTKIYLNLFSLHFQLLNFIAKSGSLETIRIHNNNVATINTQGFSTKYNTQSLKGNKGLSKRRVISRGSEAINRPIAGVGRPVNESSCPLSILNLAKRKAEKTGSKTAMIVIYGGIPYFHSFSPIIIKWNIIAPGATPKETISDKESNCLPISLLTFKALAVSPSAKSKTAAANMLKPLYMIAPR